MLGGKPTGSFVLGYEITTPQTAVVSDLVTSSENFAIGYKLGFMMRDRVNSSEAISIANIWTTLSDDTATIWTEIA